MNVRFFVCRWCIVFFNKLLQTTSRRIDKSLSFTFILLFTDSRDWKTMLYSVSRISIWMSDSKFTALKRSFSICVLLEYWWLFAQARNSSMAFEERVITQPWRVPSSIKSSILLKSPIRLLAISLKRISTFSSVMSWSLIAKISFRSVKPYSKKMN